MAVEYISRKVMDRYFDKFTRKLVRVNIRIMELEAAWNRLTLELIDLSKRGDLLESAMEHLSDDIDNSRRPA